MYLNVPTNWDDRIIDKIQEINEEEKYKYKIQQVYGATLTNIGSGRLETPVLSDEVLIEHISKIQKLGIKFNFLINSPSLGGIEHDRSKRSLVLDTISWINSLGVDIVTVSIPFIGELVNYHYPNLKVKLSTMLDVRSVQNIRLLEKLGPSIYSITLSRFINRDFKLLKEIANTATYEVELLANSLCLHNCPYQMYHSDLVCWHARTEKGWREPFTDYRAIACDEVRLGDKSEILKAPWIRPEDLPAYQSVGIHSIKIAGRTFPTNWIIKIMEAYALGSFEGNLWDLIIPFLPIHVDNKSLDGFLDYFLQKDFSCDIFCGKCRYCYDMADKHVKFKDSREEYLQDLKKRLAARIDDTIELEPYFTESRV
ncbi:U32 family peptidase [Anaerocolumna sp. AGMB13020]|uniref:U32 family peptidase n=1 Tax=Anaerocolumna sp. AGMB13020 TaxID=3081750 RepID=UPI002954CABA|nr:U32 family peptidase [Anaerocolumna sp. AGMB13020]WOO36831.1 U32 family peptidase [Anaerocolumna sp. AGMB13020]